MEDYVAGTSVLKDDNLSKSKDPEISKEKIIKIDDIKNPVDDFINDISKNTVDSLSGDKNLENEIRDSVESIIKEDMVKSSFEEIDDITNIITKNLRTDENSNIKIEAKKIHLAIENWKKSHLKEVDDFKKEKFRKSFEEEIKKTNPKLTPDQLSKSRRYANLIAENFLNHNALDDQKNQAIINNKRFGSGKIQNGWTDLQGIYGFLQKKPKQIKKIKEEYLSLKNSLRNVKLPKKLRQIRSFEDIMSSFSNSRTNNLFSRTQRSLGFIDRINNWTGGWLNKTAMKAGQKLVSKIGNQAISEFASNALGAMAQQGFKEGFSTVMNGILSGGVKTAAGAAESAIASAAGSAVGSAATGAVTGAAAAGLSATGVGAIVVAATAAVKAVTGAISKIAESLGLSFKEGLEENFGKIGSKIVGALMAIVALPAILIAMITTVILIPVIIVVTVVVFVVNIFDGELASSLDTMNSNGSTTEEIVYNGGMVGEGCPSGWPTTGRITQRPETHNGHDQGKEAFDISSATGTSVIATHNGQVKKAGWWSTGCGWGVLIESKCNGTLFETQYCHMMEGTLSVSSGQKIIKGQKVGLINTSGNSSGPHLHYQLIGLGQIPDYVPKPSTVGTMVP